MGTDVDNSGNTAAYMRKNGYGTNTMATSIDSLVLPAAADTMIHYAAQVTMLQAKSASDTVEILALSSRLTESEARRIESDALLAEIAESERDALATKMTLYSDMCAQLFPGHPGVMPICVSANADPRKRGEYKTFCKNLDDGIAKLHQVPGFYSDDFWPDSCL